MLEYRGGCEWRYVNVNGQEVSDTWRCMRRTDFLLTERIVFVCFVCKKVMRAAACRLLECIAEAGHTLAERTLLR